MAFDRTRTLRGALAGAAAAAVWAAQQPLDKRLIGTDYDDVELLGKALTRDDVWPVAGLSAHIANGAIFGAVYSNVAPAVPLPPWARGPLAGLAEHLAGWPLVLATDRLHPARRDLPTLWGSGRAFAAATWRHLLFGFVLGELERRLNPPDTEPEPVTDEVAASNGHGSIEHLVGAADR
jgi:hypothetical protein